MATRAIRPARIATGCRDGDHGATLRARCVGSGALVREGAHGGRLARHIKGAGGVNVAWYRPRVTRVADRSKLTAAEYLAWERLQETKHEFFHGEVFARPGGSYRHNALGASIGAALQAALRGRGCFVLTSDQRVSLWNQERYVYPDATVVCGAVESQAGTHDVLVNPGIIVEVLSRSTEPYDRGLKWEGYQRIASLTDYLLVSQSKVQVEHFRRREGNHWDYYTCGPGERVMLTNGAELDIDAIFKGVFVLAGD